MEENEEFETLVRTALKLVPDSTGSAITRALAGRIPPLGVLPGQQEALDRAERISYGGGGVAWSWGSGPVVVFVHGWGGRAAQMAPLAAHVAGLGLRAVALDVTAHGDATDRRGRWGYFLRDVAAVSQSLGEVHAYVGHSAGALTMMAARGVKGIRAKRYVCICAPSHPFPPIRAIRKRLDPSPGVVKDYQDFIAEQFEVSWDELERGAAWAGVGEDLLLFYDAADRFVDHTEGDRIAALCPGSRLIKTKTHGHVRILASGELRDAVGVFLRTAT